MALFALGLFASILQTATTVDSCATLIPTPVRAVTAQRFPGKPTDDYALLLTTPKFSHSLLVVATKTRQAWRIELLKDWQDSPRPDLFVSVGKPGRYRRHVEADIEADGFTSATPGVYTGGIEKFSEVYFFTAGHWIELPQSY